MYWREMMYCWYLAPSVGRWHSWLPYWGSSTVKTTLRDHSCEQRGYGMVQWSKINNGDIMRKQKKEVFNTINCHGTLRFVQYLLAEVVPCCKRKEAKPLIRTIDYQKGKKRSIE